MKKLIPILGFAATATAVPFAVSCSKPATYISINESADPAEALRSRSFNVIKSETTKLKVLLSDWTFGWTQWGDTWEINFTGSNVPSIDATHTSVFWNGTKLVPSDGTSSGDYLIIGDTITIAKALASSDNLAIWVTFNDNASDITATFRISD